MSAPAAAGDRNAPAARLRLSSRLVAFIASIRSRLLVINLLAVLVPVIGIAWARTFEREGLAALERDMRHLAETLRTILEKNFEPNGTPRFQVLASSLATVAERSRMRIRILDRSGRPVVDSHQMGAPEGPEPAVPRLLRSSVQPIRRHDAKTPATDPGPLVDRVEIRRARMGELATATRIHRRIKRVYLFLALPVMRMRRVEGIVYITRSTIPVVESLHKMRTMLLKVLLVALVFTGLLTLFLAMTISRPLARLSQAAKRIAAGDRSAKIQQKGRDEIAQLARSFDAMVRQLERRTSYISEFAANISHEFKTPLTSIRGASELLADDLQMDPETRKRFLRNILADVQRLDRLVSRMLELSRIDATIATRVKFNFTDLLHDVVAAAHDDRLVLDAPASTPYIGHRLHLQTAINALIENALHFSPPETEVRVSLAVDYEQRSIALEVIDRGQGISPANQRQIFSRFFTTEAARGGTGIGLAIVATVVEAHGGTIGVQSTPGQGARFILNLPVSPEA
jgi:two-component system sensor histidine kinase ChvG